MSALRFAPYRTFDRRNIHASKLSTPLAQRFYYYFLDCRRRFARASALGDRHPVAQAYADAAAEVARLDARSGDDVPLNADFYRMFSAAAATSRWLSAKPGSLERRLLEEHFDFLRCARSDPVSPALPADEALVARRTVHNSNE